MGRVAAVIFAGLFLCTAGALGIVVAHVGMERLGAIGEVRPAAAESADGVELQAVTPAPVLMPQPAESTAPRVLQHVAVQGDSQEHAVLPVAYSSGAGVTAAIAIGAEAAIGYSEFKLAEGADTAGPEAKVTVTFTADPGTTVFAERVDERDGLHVRVPLTVESGQTYTGTVYRAGTYQITLGNEHTKVPGDPLKIESRTRNSPEFVSISEEIGESLFVVNAADVLEASAGLGFRTRSGHFRVKAKGPRERPLEVQIVSGSKVKPIAPGLPDTLVDPAIPRRENEEIELEVNGLEPGTYILRVADRWSGRASGEFRVIVPETNTQRPRVTAYANSPHQTDTTPVPSTIPVYRAAGESNAGVYLRFSGVNVSRNQRLEFLMYQAEGERFVQIERAVADVAVTPDERWSAVLNIPWTSVIANDKVDGRLVIRAIEGDAIAEYAPINLELRANRVEGIKADNFRIKTVRIENPDPTKRGAAPTVDIDVSRDTVRTSQTDVQAILEVDAVAKTDNWPNDVFVLFYKSGARTPFLARPFAEPNGQPGVVAIEDLGVGRNAIQAALARGNSVSSRSATVDIFVRTSGPKVIGVTPANFGTAPGVNELTVRFSSENPIAKNIRDTWAGAPTHMESYFKLIRSQGTGRFDLGDAANPPLSNHLEFVRFDTASNAVTLSIAANLIVVDTYELTVIAQEIRDEFGNPMEENHVEVLGSTSSPTGAESELLAALTQRVGLPESTGPYVSFPEWTEPREYPDGFNPSDQVVTRVVRLYYFRDAHRVAQIVNRKATSHNRQGATQARQMADQARMFADRAVDERRGLEAKAVRAAREARAAENALEQMQQALIASRQNLQKIESAESEQEAAIREMERNLESARARGDDPHETQEVRDRAKKRADELEKTLEEARIKSDEFKARQETMLEQAREEVRINEERVRAAAAEIESKRTGETEATEAMESAERRESRAVEQQFRLEVAAADEDPDTYAPGVPDSDDPVEQVSVSVIGEGVIQLRGPRKGVNIIRTMINEIDSPVGQVRIGVHTVQVNGEHGDRMEPVVARIQRYIDHSRFLTVQSGQMLRNAVAYVASQKAQQIALTCPDDSQMARDQKYQDAFFGRDFMNELREMDSEFLHTGNKVLALHSMDTTSLASSLFLLGLASNETRMQILSCFQNMLWSQLPIDEQMYFDASDAERRFRCQDFKFLADNAQFVSFRGFFSMDVEGDHTLNPMQREFVRLAQIFKSRLVTEIEMNQRVLERTLIEERIGKYTEQLEEARRREEEAERKLQDARREIRSIQRETAVKMSTFIEYVVSQLDLLKPAPPSAARTDGGGGNVDPGRYNPLRGSDAVSAMRFFAKDYRGWYSDSKRRCEAVRDDGWSYYDERQDLQQFDFWITGSQEPWPLQDYDGRDEAYERASAYSLKGLPNTIDAVFRNAIDSETLRLNRFRELLNYPADVRELLDAAQASLEQLSEVKWSTTNGRVTIPYTNVLEFERAADQLDRVYHWIEQLVSQFQTASEDILRQLTVIDPDDAEQIRLVFGQWTQLRSVVWNYVEDKSLEAEFEPLATPVNQAFRQLLTAGVDVQLAVERAEEARRPLDHKKFLDMLIDDVQEKYIELLEGTRAHTAVVDEYIKRLATALDDDFNTQFYEPAFRAVRETGYTWDVQFGQIEQTTVLCNNRGFAKVQPQATMEFDLPKRQIVIAEALNAAQAAMQDYGALISNPDFLALTKLFGGQSTASPFGGGGPTPMVRNVLPGLPSQTDEKLMIQGESAQPKFASQLEGLIPDPAIYAFETGTGFELRPVIQPDGQAVVFDFDYMYTTNVREPVRADEKHLGRVKRHFISTDVQLGNYELREVSRYRVALRASRTARGVPLLEDIPGLGILFRPLPQSESSLQQNIILAQATIFPTLFDLMGLRWAPAVSDLDQLRLQEEEFVYRNRQRFLRNDVYDYSSDKVDEFLRIPEGDRRPDLYRTQETIPDVHPNSYFGPGLNRQDSHLQPGYDPRETAPPTQYTPGATGGNTAPLLRVPPSAGGSPTPVPEQRGTQRHDSPSPMFPPSAPAATPVETGFLSPLQRGGKPGVGQRGRFESLPDSYPPNAPPASVRREVGRIQPMRPAGDVRSSRTPELLPVPDGTRIEVASGMTSSGMPVLRSVDEVLGGGFVEDSGFAVKESPAVQPETTVGQDVRPSSRSDVQNRSDEKAESESGWRLWPFSRKEDHRNNERGERTGEIIPAGHEEPSERGRGGFRFRIPGFGRTGPVAE